MKKVAITGSTGLVGSRIVELLSPYFEFIPLTSERCDITNQDQVHACLKDLRYDLFLHLAGYTNVDKAEQEPTVAMKLNRDATGYLVEEVTSKKKPFIYISTDFVFDGLQPPYTETSAPYAVSTYGQSKLEGEKKVGSHGMIVRIAYPYRAAFEQKKDIVRTLKFLMEQGKQLTMINDSLMVPTFIDDIAHSLRGLMDNYSPEIFHVVGANALSPFDLGVQIARTFGLDERLVGQISFEGYFAGKATRPRYCDIRSTKALPYAMHTLEEGLTIIKKQLGL